MLYRKQKNMNKFENFSAPIQITEEELKKYSHLALTSPDEPELLKWMGEKGIKFDSGNVDVQINGQTEKMVTSREDFGTIVYDEKRHGTIESGF